MPKVLIVIARLNKGGTAQFISHLYEEMPKNVYQIVVATGYVQGSEIEDQSVKKINPIRIKHLGRSINPIKDLLSFFELRKLVSQIRPDIIYSHTFKAGLLVRLLGTNIPVIHTFHGHLLDDPTIKGIKKSVLIRIERSLAKRTKILVTIGKQVGRELIEVGIGKKSQYFSMDPGIHPLILSKPFDVRKKFKLEKEKRPIVAWVARMAPVKRPDRVTKLALSIPEAKFIMAGGGELFQTIKNQQIHNIDVLGWVKAEEIYAIADVAINTSENEGMPISLIEAQYAGIPVVATKVGSVSEVIENGKTGFVVKDFDKDFANRLKTLIENPSMHKKMGKAAAKRSKKEFDPRRFVQDHLKLFKRAL